MTGYRLIVLFFDKKKTYSIVYVNYVHDYWHHILEVGQFFTGYLLPLV